MDVEIISMEMIKPSFPTPNHLKIFNLCRLDQLIPAAYAPIIIFYPNNESSSRIQVLETLKRSLSETLTRFYPLAGTLVGELSINCDDQGACFTTAKVNKYCLSDFLGNPDLKLISKFLPCGLVSIGSCVSNIQVSIFECGGLAIGICISHRILDGTALSKFLKSWSDSAKEEKLPASPDFSASFLFPTNDSTLKDASVAMWGSLFKKGQFVTKRFVFDVFSIAALKEKAVVGPATGRHLPTRVETVSAFIWKCAIQSCQVTSGFEKPSLLTHIVNLRKRAVPNFSERSIGNLIWIGSTKIKGTVIQNLGFPGFVDEVRQCISKIDGDYVKKLRGDEGSVVMNKYLREMEEMGSEGVDHFGFSSWCKLGFYDVDFGWGKPVWVSSIDASGPFFTNLVILIDTACGNGIEAWVTLDEKDMDVLESGQEFRAFTSLNPSLL